MLKMFALGPQFVSHWGCPFIGCTGISFDINELRIKPERMKNFKLFSYIKVRIARAPIEVEHRSIQLSHVAHIVECGLWLMMTVLILIPVCIFRVLCFLFPIT